MAKNTDGDSCIRTGNLDKIRTIKMNSGETRITPFIVIQMGDEEGDTTSEDDIDDVADALDGILQVPYFVICSPVSVYVVEG